MNKLSIAGLLSAAAIIGAIAAISAFADQVQGYILKPAYGHMAQSKLYDMRTDELADDVERTEVLIRDLETEAAETPNISEAHRRSLERQIERHKSELLRMDEMLDHATAADRKILAELTALSS